VAIVISRKWLNIIVIICVAGLITFLYLGNAPLLDPDEPVYAQTALEMLQHEDFISPRIYGDFWYDKPPMYYWLVAASFKLFGVGEFAARFPSALLAVLGSVLIYLCGRKLFTERAGFLSALILSTSIEYFYLSKAAVTDITLTFFLTAALLAFLQEKYYLLYICMALAVVTKGPIGILLCGGIIMLYLLLTGNLAQLKRMKLGSGIALFTVVAAPWYLSMYYYHGMDFINTFLGFHNITRFLQPEHTGTRWYYYIPVLIIGFFPWTAFLPQAAIAGVREQGTAKNAVYFLLVWLSVVFLFFTFSQTKLVSYILPMYPPLALLIGWYFDKAWAEKRAGILTGASLIFTLAAALLAAGAVYGVGHLAVELAALLEVLAGCFLLFVVWVWLLSYRQNFRGVFIANVMGMILFTTFLMGQILPVIAPALEVKSLVSEFKQYYDGQSPVYVAKFYRPGFAFYSGISGIEFKSQEDMFDNTQKAYFVVQKKYYEGLPPLFQSKLHLLASVADKVVLLHEIN
jgi:4-amino-4-deoxy-L-arabinose transferase-like glycosyltransferase